MLANDTVHYMVMEILDCILYGSLQQPTEETMELMQLMSIREVVENNLD
jgi:hypothetical protein